MLFSLLFYFTILFVCIFIAHLADKYNSKILLYLLISILVIVTGFRGDEVGIDTPNYIEVWDEIMVDGFVVVELGFQWLIMALQKVTTNPTSLFFSCSIIIYLLLVIRLWDFRKIASFPMMITALYTFSFMPSMNIMRQYCAIAIIFYSTRYFFKKQYVKFLVGVLLATLFHTSALSAISFLGFELLIWHDLSRAKRLFFLLTIVFFPMIGLAVYDFIDSEYGQYFENEEQSLGILTLLKFIFIVTSYYCSKLWSKKYLISDDQIENYSYISKFVFGSFLLGVTLESLAYFFPFMGRIGLPFSIWGIVFWGMLFKLTKNIVLKEVYFLAFLLLFGMPFLLSIVFNGYGTVPYYFCW